MKKLHTILCAGALAASVFSPVFAHAQSATSSDNSQGTLGKRYIGLDYGVSDHNNSSENLYGASLKVNLPVYSFLDVSVGLGRGWIKYDSSPYSKLKIETTSVGTDFVFYKAFANGVKPFVSVGFESSWNTYNYQSMYEWYLNNGEYKGSSASLGAAVGVEIPFRWVSLTPMIGYSGSLEDSDTQTVEVRLQASSWITSRVGVFADVGYTKPRKSNSDNYSMTYGAGMRFKF